MKKITFGSKCCLYDGHRLSADYFMNILIYTIYKNLKPFTSDSLCTSVCNFVDNPYLFGGYFKPFIENCFSDDSYEFSCLGSSIIRSLKESYRNCIISNTDLLFDWMKSHPLDVNPLDSGVYVDEYGDIIYN